MIRILDQSDLLSSRCRVVVSVVLMAIACMAPDGPALAAAPECPGDYNNDGICTDAADYVLWRKNPAAYGGDPAGYNPWRAHFGEMIGIGSGAAIGSSSSIATPEPSGLLLAVLGACFGLAFFRHRVGMFAAVLFFGVALSQTGYFAPFARATTTTTASAPTRRSKSPGPLTA